jgi:hypothetical protein
MQVTVLGIINVDFDIIGPLIKLSISIRYCRISGSIEVQYISFLHISRTPVI